MVYLTYSTVKGGVAARMLVEGYVQSGPPDGRIVLVVDDDVDLCQFMALVVEEETGAKALQAGDGREALSTLEESHPSLIVTDVRMPNVTGTELVEAVRHNPAVQATPIIVVAASESARREAMAAGADDYLDKPFDVESFVRKVKRHLDSDGHGMLG